MDAGTSGSIRAWWKWWWGEIYPDSKDSPEISATKPAEDLGFFSCTKTGDFGNSESLQGISGKSGLLEE